MSWVPVVDLSRDDAPAAVAAACERVGFLTVVGHAVPEAVIASAWSTARAFFDLPLHERMAVAMPRPGDPYGYSPVAGETLARSLGDGPGTPPDLKQSFAIGPVDRPTHTITDPDEAFAWSDNLWPAALPALRTASEAYFRAVADRAARLVVSQSFDAAARNGV